MTKSEIYARINNAGKNADSTYFVFGECSDEGSLALIGQLGTLYEKAKIAYNRADINVIEWEEIKTDIMKCFRDHYQEGGNEET